MPVKTIIIGAFKIQLYFKAENKEESIDGKSIDASKRITSVKQLDQNEIHPMY